MDANRNVRLMAATFGLGNRDVKRQSFGQREKAGILTQLVLTGFPRYIP
jgi:hypothetical protein